MSAPMAAPVLLGLCDEIVKDSFHTTWASNKIGGNPDLMYPEHSFKQLSCGLCSQKLLLITQIYCPLENQEFHRTLYVFACVTKSCFNKNQSWTVIRTQIPTSLPNEAPKDTDKQQTAVTMATDDWCDDADDWGTDEAGEDDGWNTSASNSVLLTGDKTVKYGESQEAACTLEIDLESAKLSQRIMGINLKSESNHGDKWDSSGDKPQKEPADHEDTLTFQAYFVNVFDEPTLDEVLATSHEQRLMKEYQKREGVNFKEWQDGAEVDPPGKRGGKESYEKAAIKHGDKFFHKFSKKLALCPEQCIRYSLNGSPLYLTTPNEATQAHNMPCCSYCGASRIFELQLMPGLVNLLRVPNNPDKTVEFGVVLVYTCRDSCWDQTNVQIRTEYVIVQADPDDELLNRKGAGT